MSDIEQKALALVNEVLSERHECLHEMLERDWSCWTGALCRAIEQKEATKQEFDGFRQEVSDAVKETLVGLENDCHTEAVVIASNELLKFIIPKPKPDPLVDILWELGMAQDRAGIEFMATRINETLEARGLEIREKNDD